MAKVKITGHAQGSGVFTITAPNSNTDRTITLPDASVTLGTDATKLPLAGGTMTGDLILGDNVKLELGNASGGDLRIYHDANHSRIQDAGTGDLILSGQIVAVQNAGHSETMAKFNENGDVKLYHNDALKIATTATGVNVTGKITGAVGSVLQVVQALKTDATSSSASGETVVSGLSVTITPSSSSSKLLITSDVMGFSHSGHGMSPLIKHGSAYVMRADSSGSRARGGFAGQLYTGDDGSSGQMVKSISTSVLYSPNTTSAVQLDVVVVGNGSAWKINATEGDTNSADNTRGISHITVMEIGA